MISSHVKHVIDMNILYKSEYEHVMTAEQLFEMLGEDFFYFLYRYINKYIYFKYHKLINTLKLECQTLL